MLVRELSGKRTAVLRAFQRGLCVSSIRVCCSQNSTPERAPQVRGSAGVSAGTQDPMAAVSVFPMGQCRQPLAA
jgi:hypothetical protein